MPILDVFSSDAFSMMSLIQAIEKVPYLPSRLGSLRLFEPVPAMFKQVMIEERSGTLSLIPLSERGAPLTQRQTGKRTARSFQTYRVAKADTIQADELRGIRQFGSETAVVGMQREVTRRYSGPAGIVRDIELTWEYMRLAAIQGLFLDPGDGSTVLDFHTEFGITANTEVDLDLDNASPASGALRKAVTAIVRTIQRKLEMPGVSINVHAMCGDAFWDDLIAHSEVRETYLNQTAAAQLRAGVAFETFNFAGVTFENYRGTDDASTVAINTDKAKFFPVGAPGVFRVVWGPSEFAEDLSAFGRPITPKIIPDRDRNSHVSVEAYSYPLFICTKPGTLVPGKRT